MVCWKGMSIEQAFGVEGVQCLLIVVPKFMILDLDIAHGRMRGAVSHHPRQDQQRHPTAGHVRAEAMLLMPSSA